MESTRAHTTVEIDGASYQRYGVKPYGSGLYRSGEHDGVLYSGTYVRHRTTTRFAGIIHHSRVLAFRPGEWLLVHDRLRDPLRKRHSFTQHFHFSPQLEVVAHGAGSRVEVPGSPLHVVPLLGTEALPPVRGQEEPELLGWVSHRSKKLDPCWTAAFRAERLAACSMATLLAFGESAPVPLPSNEPGELRWSHEGQEWRLVFGVPERDDFTFHSSMRPVSSEAPDPAHGEDPRSFRHLVERFSRFPR